MEVAKSVIAYTSVALQIILLPIYWLNVIGRAIFHGDGKSLNGQIIMVSGAGNGLGREMTLQLVRQGAYVVGVDIRQEDLDDTVNLAKEITQIEGIIKPYVCDISDRAAVSKLRDAVLKENGHVDILINNAAVIYLSQFETGDDEHLERVVNVNILGNLWMTRAFLPSMKKRGKGHIVFISSLGSIFPDKDLSIYCATKAALTSLGQTLRLSLESGKKWANIKVTTAHPFIMNTSEIALDCYKGTLKPVSKGRAASTIINAIKNEYGDIVLPGGEIGYALIHIIRFIPNNLIRSLYKAFNVSVKNIEDKKLIDSFVTQTVSYKTMVGDYYKNQASGPHTNPK